MKQRGGHGTANEVRVRAGSDCGNPGWRMDVKITRSKKIEDIIFWGPSVLSNQSFQVQSPAAISCLQRWAYSVCMHASFCSSKSFSSSPSRLSRSAPGWRDRRSDPAR